MKPTSQMTLDVYFRQCVGIDISKDKFTACLMYDRASDVGCCTKSIDFDNTKSGFNQMVRWSRKEAVKSHPLTYLMEPTGVYYEHLAYHLHKIGQTVYVVLPNKAVSENERLLSSRERYMLSFVRAHASLVEELDDVMQAYEYTEQLCKRDGLSQRMASECRRHVNTHLMTRGEKVRRLADMLIGYFNREEALLNGDETHNITSDIIESTFGCFKERMSPIKNNGYTTLVLLIPLLLRVSTMEDYRSFNVWGLLVADYSPYMVL